jgi:tetratricopeptide (TPR) repeat protein
MDPELWETRYNMGLALVRTSERERAAKQFQLVLLQNTDYFPAHSARGLLLYNLNRLDASADEFKEALRLNPRDVNAASDLAKVLHTQRRYTAEIYYLRQGLAWHPPPELAYQMRFALGVAYFQNGNKDDAVDTLRKLKDEYPKASEVHFTLANAYAKDLEVQEAAAEYEATIRLNPDNNPARLSLGKAHLENGEFTCAPPIVRSAQHTVWAHKFHILAGQRPAAQPPHRVSCFPGAAPPCISSRTRSYRRAAKGSRRAPSRACQLPASEASKLLRDPWASEPQECFEIEERRLLPNRLSICLETQKRTNGCKQRT